MSVLLDDAQAAAFVTTNSLEPALRRQTKALIQSVVASAVAHCLATAEVAAARRQYSQLIWATL